jgi:hypothetical protein
MSVREKRKSWQNERGLQAGYVKRQERRASRGATSRWRGWVDLTQSSAPREASDQDAAVSNLGTKSLAAPIARQPQFLTACNSPCAASIGQLPHLPAIDALLLLAR